MQNFLAMLDMDIADSELVEKILQMFSDIPTTTQAIAKLKALRQGENESILAYNQRYRILVERVEGQTIEQITSPVAMEMYLGTIIPSLRKSIKNSLFWNSKHAPRTVGEAMSKAQQLYVNHLYATGDEQEGDHSKTREEVVINEISRKFENRYQDRCSDFRDSLQNQRDNYSQEARTNKRRWQPYNNLLNSRQPRHQEVKGNCYAGEPMNIDTMNSQQQGDQSDQPTRQEGAPVPIHRTVDSSDRIDTSTSRPNRQERVQNSVLRGSYTHIMVNPMQLSDVEFTNWMEKLVEAIKNRQEKRPRPYRNFRKPYNNDRIEQKKPVLKNRLQPAQELDIQTIMTSFNCKYDDVGEAVDLYNMDVDECRTAWLNKNYQPDEYLVSTELDEEICAINEYQRRGTTFPVAIKTNGDYEHTFALMDRGASQSCINYTMFLKIRNPRWSTRLTPRVFAADGSDLGSMEIVQLMLKLGDKEVIQDFVVLQSIET